MPFAKLLISAKSREVNLHSILEKELGPIPLALFTETGQMRKTTKSQLMHTLEEKYLINAPSKDYSSVTNKSIIIDAMSIVQTTKASGTFYEYAQILLKIVLDQSQGYSRVDAVFDVYQIDSIKAAERSRRGEQKMVSISICHDSVPVPKNWNDFLSNINNKNELVNYIIQVWSRSLHRIPTGVSLFCSAKEVCILRSSSHQNCEKLTSNQDEADTRLILHAADALSESELVVIRSVDTDVIIIVLHHFHSVLNERSEKDVIMLIGMGQHKRYISLYQLATNIPPAISINLLSLHALTGCDSVSSIFRVSKKRAMDVLEKGSYDLSLGPEDWAPLSEDTYRECERFISHLYGSYDNATEARYKTIALKNVAGEAQLPPSQNALQYHIKRANYQVTLWKLALSPMILPQPTSMHGWDDNLLPIMSDAQDDVNCILSACKCKKSGCKSNTCKCGRQQMKCCGLCECADCQNCDDIDENEDTVSEDEESESEEGS